MEMKSRFPWEWNVGKCFVKKIPINIKFRAKQRTITVHMKGLINSVFVTNESDSYWITY